MKSLFLLVVAGLLLVSAVSVTASTSPRDTNCISSVVRSMALKIVNTINQENISKTGTNTVVLAVQTMVFRIRNEINLVGVVDGD